MEIINYDSFIEKLNETKHNNYNCTILLFYSGDLMTYDDIVIEDETEFYNTFSDLIYYIETKCCNPEENNNFIRIIDDLLSISSKRKLDKIDVNFILFKEKVLTFIDKFKNKIITEDILNEQLYKLFEIKDYNNLIAELQDRYKIITK